MAKVCRGITVHAVYFDHRGGPVFYASLPGAGKNLNGGGANGAADRNHLASVLLEHAMASGSPLRKCRHSFDSAAAPMRVAQGPLGRPHLLSGEYRMPAISFSEGGGKVWAALCGDASDIGIDAAAADEFRGEYPLHRVFHNREIQHAMRLTGRDPEKASALLWSIKEAVVKALGCGFHLVAPRQVRVFQTIRGDRENGYAFPVCLSRKALVRTRIGAGRSIWVRSFPRDNMWLSIALLNGQPQ